MSDTVLLIYLSLSLFLCLFAGKVVKQLKLPNVTGYLVIGLVASSILGTEFVQNLMGMDVADNMVDRFSVVSNLATGFIAFSIGTEFEFKYIKKLGKAPIIIAVFESVGAVIFVAGILILTGHDVALSLVMGAIAAATDPAATILVAKQYKAEGPVTRTLVPVVAIDDATALMSFGICVALAKAITGHLSVATLLEPIYEIAGSLVFGIFLGFIFTILIKYFTGRGNRLAITIAMVSFCVSISGLVNFSPLLACMAMSVTVVNTSKNCKVVFEQMDRMTPPIFMLFFFVSGAGIDLSILPSIGFIGVLYIVFRVIGKMAGAALGGQLSKAEPNVKKYLGIGLIPQAGVAIGLATMSASVVPEYTKMITAVVLCGTVIYELVGPIMTKVMLTKIGEIKPDAQ